MTTPQRAELRRMAEEATKGPWKHYEVVHDTELVADRISAADGTDIPDTAHGDYTTVDYRAEDLSELAKLRDEVETMRPVFVAALAWFEAKHVNNSNHRLGECDECPAREAEILLRATISEVSGG